jgi:predicted DNA-binding transcriptional regulator AlpA
VRTLRGCDSRGGRALSEHHLDRRAGELIAIGAGDPNDLLTTKDVAAWFGMSVITLEIWRSKGKGPPFTKLTPRMIRYRRGDALNWLAKRTCTSTVKYRNRYFKDAETRARHLNGAYRCAPCPPLAVG